MTTKNQSRYYALNNIHTTIQHLEDIKKMDIANRKAAKASRKGKWTRSIKRTNQALGYARVTKKLIAAIQQRV